MFDAADDIQSQTIQARSIQARCASKGVAGAQTVTVNALQRDTTHSLALLGREFLSLVYPRYPNSANFLL